MTNSMAAPVAPTRVLLVEDDPEVAATIRQGLDSKLFALEQAGTLAEGRQRATTRQYDALILDLALPDGCGLELADALRGAGIDVPILILTARSTVDARLEGFRHGADDYLCKPFAIEELEARIRAIVRRSRPQSPHLLSYADLQLDLVRRVAQRGALRVSLSAREAELLAYFIRCAEEVLPRARILEEVWGGDAESDSNVLNVYVNYLRNKLEHSGNLPVIHTVRGVGYLRSTTDPAAGPE